MSDDIANVPLQPKEIICDCGNRITTQLRSHWCQKCGRKMFYDPKDKLKSRINSLYFTAIIVLAVGFLTYFFIEMILTPVLNNFQ